MIKATQEVSQLSGRAAEQQKLSTVLDKLIKQVQRLPGVDVNMFAHGCKLMGASSSDGTKPQGIRLCGVEKIRMDTNLCF